MPKAICPRQALRSLLPSSTRPANQRQLALQLHFTSSLFIRCSYRLSCAFAHRAVSPRLVASLAAPFASPRSDTSGRPGRRISPSNKPTCRLAPPSAALRPASRASAPKPLPTPPPHQHDIVALLAVAARSAATLLLTSAVVLSATVMGPSGGAAATAAAAVATGTMAAPSPVVAAAAATLPGGAPADTALVLPETSSRVAGPSASVPSVAAPATAAAAVPIRFTRPEMIETLPPLPTEFPPLPELKLPPYTTTKLRNGLRVFLLADDEVPLVRATLLMRGGQYGSPPDKVGLASLTSFVQRAGGSVAHPAAVLDVRLEELAASIEFGAGPQAVSADMQCLSEDVEEVMGLMAELVRTPLLPADKLAVYRSQVLNALDHQNDSPGSIARRKVTKLLYGADSIYARTPTRAGVSSITPDDMRAYVARWERPDTAVLGVVGAFEPGRMMALLEAAFGDWAPAAGQTEAPPEVPRGLPPQVPSPGDVPSSAAAAAAAAVAGSGGESVAVAVAPSSSPSSPSPAAASVPAAAAPPPPPSSRRPVVFLVDRPGLTQANVLTAEPGISLSDPDVYALDVLGGVFNSFGGQLFDTLRSREGLAYSVSGGWDSPPDHQGLFVAGGQTSAPGEFLRSLRQLLSQSAAQPPSQAELEASKEETLNSFAFNFASTASQLQRILVYDLLGLPQNYLFKYIQGIERVGQQDVARAAAAHLHPERQAVVVVADRELAQPSLEAAGFQVLPMRLED